MSRIFQKLLKYYMQLDFLERLNNPRMEHYKNTYRRSRRWDGVFPLKDKTVIVYCEQGFGDIIQFARYFSFLKQHNCKIILHAPKELHRLLKTMAKIDDVFDKENTDLPDHDYHILSMSLPFLLNRLETNFPAKPYIFLKEKADLSEFEEYKKIGIAWEGNPEHSNNEERSCPLKHFRALIDEKTKLFMLTNQAHLPQLIDEEIELYSTEITDFYDTAKLINAMDFVVAVDTAILHLAGAMHKKGFGLLSYRYDPRWDIARWYKSIKLLKQDSPDNWQTIFNKLVKIIP